MTEMRAPRAFPQTLSLPRQGVRESRSPQHAVVDDNAKFASFVSLVEVQLRQALVARYGVDMGADATAAALEWAWKNRNDLEALENPVGFLYRVGQSSMRPQFAWLQRRALRFPSERVDRGAPDAHQAADLGDVLDRLPDLQRVCVLLVHAHSWPYGDVAVVLGISVAAVNNHVHRGTARLRLLLKEEP